MITLNFWFFLLALVALFIFCVAGWATIILAGIKELVDVDSVSTSFPSRSQIRVYWKSLSRIRKLKRIAIACLALIAITPFWLIEFVHGRQVLLSEGSIIQDFPKETILWQRKWNYINKHPRVHLVDYSNPNYHAQVAMTAHPITENPKVRSLIYIVDVEVEKSAQAMVLFEKTVGQLSENDGDNKLPEGRKFAPMINPVKSLLYEFNERHSKELAPLYNPLDLNQQARFRRLIESFLNEPLKEMGLRLKRPPEFAIGD